MVEVCIQSSNANYQKKLDSSVKDLTVLAKDLRAGKITDGAQLDGILARASRDLAEWHYFKAKESFGKKEEGYAAQNLEAAAAHLQHAANSAHYQYGSDTIKLFKTIRKHGKTYLDTEIIDRNLLGKQLDDIEKVVKEISDALDKASKTAP